jgi:hypothetical protein
LIPEKVPFLNDQFLFCDIIIFFPFKFQSNSIQIPLKGRKLDFDFCLNEKPEAIMNNAFAVLLIPGAIDMPPLRGGCPVFMGTQPPEGANIDRKMTQARYNTPPPERANIDRNGPRPGMLHRPRKGQIFDRKDHRTVEKSEI